MPTVQENSALNATIATAKHTNRIATAVERIADTLDHGPRTAQPLETGGNSDLLAAVTTAHQAAGEHSSHDEIDALHEAIRSLIGALPQPLREAALQRWEADITTDE